MWKHNFEQRHENLRTSWLTHSLTHWLTGVPARIPLDRRILKASPESGQGSRSQGVEPLRGKTLVWGRSRATGELTGHDEAWDVRLAGCEHWHVLGGGGEGRETTAWPTSPNVEILSGMLKLPKAGKTFRFSKVWGPSTAPVNWSRSWRWPCKQTWPMANL